MLFSSSLLRCCVLTHQLCQHLSLSLVNSLYFSLALGYLAISPLCTSLSLCNTSLNLVSEIWAKGIFPQCYSLYFTCGHTSSMHLPSLQIYKPLLGARKLCAWVCFPGTHPTSLSGAHCWPAQSVEEPRRSTPPVWAGLSVASVLSNCWLTVWGVGWQERIIFITILNQSGGISSEQKAAAGFPNVVKGSANYAAQIETAWLPWLLDHGRPGNCLWSCPVNLSSAWASESLHWRAATLQAWSLSKLFL